MYERNHCWEGRREGWSYLYVIREGIFFHVIRVFMLGVDAFCYFGVSGQKRYFMAILNSIIMRYQQISLLDPFMGNPEFGIFACLLPQMNYKLNKN